MHAWDRMTHRYFLLTKSISCAAIPCVVVDVVVVCVSSPSQIRAQRDGTPRTGVFITAGQRNGA